MPIRCRDCSCRKLICCLYMAAMIIVFQMHAFIWNYITFIPFRKNVCIHLMNNIR